MPDRATAEAPPEDPSPADHPDPAVPPHAPRVSDVLPVAALTALASVLLSLRTTVGSELRYVDAARTMVEGGDWVVPRLAGVPYMEKPILFYWLSAGAQWLFGISDVAARLPSILGTVAMLSVAFGLAFELRGRAFAWATAGLLAGSFGFLAMGTTLTTDSLFAGALAVTWYALWRHLRDPASGWKWCFWGASAAAMLAKGPLGPAMVVASSLVLVLAERRLARFLRLRLFVGGALFLALCAPWHVALWLRDPRLVEFFYVRQNLRAAVDGQVNHSGPIWFYVPVVLALLFPYSVLVVTAFVGAGRRLLAARSAPDAVRLRLHAFLAAVAIGPLLLLTFSASKLGSYVLPVLPFLGVLVAREAARALDRPGRLVRVATLVPAVVLPGAVGVGVPRLLQRYDVSGFQPAYVPMFTAAILALLGGLVASAWLGWRGRRLTFVPMAAGVVAAIAFAIPVAIDPGARFDARVAARTVAALREPGDLVVAAGGEVQDYSLQLELGGRVAILGRARELGMGHFVAYRGREHRIPRKPSSISSAHLPEDPWLLDDAELAALWRSSRRIWVIGDDEDIEPLRESPGIEIHTLFDDGKRAVYTNRPVGE